MKNIVIIVLLAAAAYKGYMSYAQQHQGAFDSNGKPLALLFTIDQCGKPCDEVTALLDRRHVAYEEIVVAPDGEPDERWQAFGAVRAAPFLVVGDERIIGSDLLQITFALGAVLGDDHLRRIEAEILQQNFAADGSPKLVMYTMDGCGYCESAAQYFVQHGISYEERNSSRDPAAARQLEAMQAGTPVIFYGHHVFVGWGSGVRDKVLALL